MKKEELKKLSVKAQLNELIEKIGSDEVIARIAKQLGDNNMKKEKYEELKSFEKLKYLVKRLGYKELFDNLVEMMNESELEWFTDEIASIYDLLKD